MELDQDQAAAARQRAVTGLADAVEGMGLLEELLDELTRRRAILRDAIEPPRPGERRVQQWRGRREDSTVSADPIPKVEEDGGSSLLDRTGDDMWKRFREKAKPGGPQRQRGGGSREG